jgi:membrane protein YdbS with pleckstrin-like domain
MPILVIKDGEQYGPYELNDLAGYVSQGSFTLTDLCWQDGWADWQPLSSIISRPPPPAAPVETQAQPQAATSSPAKQSEEILWEGHANFWRYAGQIIWSILIGLIVAVFTFGIGLLIMPFWWWAIYAERKKRKYIVTNKRVKVEFGLFTKSTKEVRIRDIKSINVVKKGMAGLFGIGTLEFSSAGGSGVEVAFEAINNAQKIRDMVANLQE